MRKTLLLALLLLALPALSFAQSRTIDSLKQLLQTEKQDTARAKLLLELSKAYYYSKPDTVLLLSQQALLLSRSAHFAVGEVGSLIQLGSALRLMGNYPKALALFLEALKKAEATGDKLNITRILGNIGTVYSAQGDYRQSVNYTFKCLASAKSMGNQRITLIALVNLGDNYEKLNLLDSAKLYTEQAYQMAVQQKSAAIGIALNNLGNIYSKLGQDTLAMTQYRQSLPYYQQGEIDDGLCEIYLGIAKLFQRSGRADSSLYYAQQCLAKAQQAGFIGWVMQAANFLTTYYTALHKVDSAFVYQSAAIIAKDSLFSQEKSRQIQNLGYEETVRQQQIEEAKKEAQTQLKFNMLFGGLGTLLIVAFLLFRNNRQKQKANVQIMHQKQKVENTLQELKSTQAQLVQSEKMASLGELTAGIAHEIQNPLNFVNNFAQLNKEMLAEMRDEIDSGHYAEVKNLATDIEANEEKISHHGRRADAIVKGMLQHSRHSTGEKEATNINAIAEEYLRLSLYAMRTKDKTFNATLQTDFDKTMGKVAVVPQDIGRVLLNLFNNAFYAVHEKKKKLNDGYEPTVFVSTKRSNGNIEIKVADNGTGIPQNVLEKIYQPFFTTKPTGQGSGLGLSLSYDVITKEHGGTIQVESNEGQGTAFVINIPC